MANNLVDLVISFGK